jgi:hypothetical protein
MEAFLISGTRIMYRKMRKKSLPLIDLKINPDDGSYVSAIALVNAPAIEIDFLHFNKQPIKQFFTSDDERFLLGYAMTPDIPIYRYSEEFGEYAVKFDKQTIKEIAQHFSKKGLNNAFNIEHSKQDAGSFMWQSWIVDEAKGISAPKGLPNIDGGWICGCTVTDDAVWAKIKSGEIKGFSIEGLFDFIDTETNVVLELHSKTTSAFDKNLNDFLNDFKELLIENR